MSENFALKPWFGLGLAIALLVFSGQGFAAESAADQDHPVAESAAISLYFDNDAFYGTDKDQDYTGGFAVSFSGAEAARHAFSVDPALSWINHKLAVSGVEASEVELRSYEFGVAVFTPTEIKIAEPIANDRPYAGLIYVANAQQSIDFESRSSLISSLSVGVLGLPAVGEMQNHLHQITGSNEAEGWRNQISDGGEPTFKYSLTLQKYIDTGRKNVQATTMAGLSVGYVTEAVFGASIRTGNLRTPWWSFNVHNSNYGEKSSIAVPTSKTLDELFFVAGANVKLRVYNVFLQGQFRDSAVYYSRRDVEPLVYEGWFGIGSEFTSGIRLAYLLRRQTSELKTGTANRSFTYGELIASYKF